MSFWETTNGRKVAVEGIESGEMAKAESWPLIDCVIMPIRGFEDGRWRASNRGNSSSSADEYEAETKNKSR